MNIATTTPQDLIMWVITILLVFFIGRVVVLWYYKIDLRLQEQQETNKLLRELINLQKKSSINYIDNSLEKGIAENEIDVNDPEKFNEVLKRYNK